MDQIIKSNQDSNANRFINSYNKVDKYLRNLVNDDTWTPFTALVDIVGRSDSNVKAYINDLKQFASLRNAIIHSKHDNMIIAEPNDWTVNRIEKICETLFNPPTLIPLYQRDVLTMDVNESIGKAVTLMYEKGFSQIPVYDSKSFKDLFTTNTIARWLGAVASEDIFSLNDTRISEVLEYSEEPMTYVFMKRIMTVFDVLQKYDECFKVAKKLDAILITENGHKDEKLLGIITVYDLIEIQKLL